MRRVCFSKSVKKVSSAGCLEAALLTCGDVEYEVSFSCVSMPGQKTLLNVGRMSSAAVSRTGPGMGAWRA